MISFQLAPGKMTTQPTPTPPQTGDWRRATVCAEIVPRGRHMTKQLREQRTTSTRQPTKLHNSEAHGDTMFSTRASPLPKTIHLSPFGEQCDSLHSPRPRSKSHHHTLPRPATPYYIIQNLRKNAGDV